ncbi:MAG: hypothetical protein KF870_16275 [Leadbetterella sp.]|nr:hypothetical protein [Leadbetterella sp.]
MAKTVKVNGCVKKLSDEWRDKAKADYVLFIKRGEDDIISTFVTDDILPAGSTIQVDGDFTNLSFNEIETNDEVENWHEKVETQFKSITELMNAKEANKTYTPNHGY